MFHHLRVPQVVEAHNQQHHGQLDHHTDLVLWLQRPVLQSDRVRQSGLRVVLRGGRP